MFDTANLQSIALRRYWVVGGEYETMAFERLVPGTGSIVGSFGSREDAEGIWRGLSEGSRNRATVRFSIASEPKHAAPRQQMLHG